MQKIKELISSELQTKISELGGELTGQDILLMLEYPPDKTLGDVALPCFKLSRTLRRSPVQIAEELAAKLQSDDAISKVVAVNGYLNIFISDDYIGENTISDILQNGENYGRSDIVIGTVDNLAEKFDNLRAFYEQGLSKYGWNKYKTINLKFKNQIVCTKRI